MLLKLIVIFCLFRSYFYGIHVKEAGNKGASFADHRDYHWSKSCGTTSVADYPVLFRLPLLQDGDSSLH